VEACLYGARQLSGQKAFVEEILAEVLKDEPFYRSSGGGVTLGGGEPFMQFEFTREFLKRCREKSLHTAVETCGYVPWEQMKEALEYVDLVYYDIKHMNSAKHQELTEVPNDLILENAQKLFSGGKIQVIIRVPIIPGYNDAEENMKETARFVAESGGKRVELLPYHRFGISKYSQLDREYELRKVQIPTEKHMQRLKSIVTSMGISVE
jgi:pyruvate formate lyase activating enzyme